MNGSQRQIKHLASLAIRYNVGKYKNDNSVNFLYFILRKAELGIQITDLEFQWLADNSLYSAIGALRDAQKFRIKEQKRIEAQFSELRVKYRIPENLELPLSSPIYSILWKLDTESKIQDTELKLLNKSGCTETVTLIPDILNFSKLKIKYKATQYLNQFPEDPLYPILQKLDLKEQLSDVEANWLLKCELDTTLEIYWQQDKEKQAEIEFSELKSKYQLSSHQDTSISSPLYSVLKKLKAKQELEDSECKWLDEQNLTRLIEIERVRKQKRIFTQLKSKYKANQSKNLDISSHLFTVLEKIEIDRVSEADIQWLTREKLTETVKIARQIHFKTLKNKYQILDPKLPMNPFYEIMLKLEREERLDPKQIVQLIIEDRLSSNGKIATAHYRLEAIFYEREYQRTANKWNLPSASSNWRKANQPKKALEITNKIDWNQVKELKLKSALLVTRGGAFRDLDRLNDAETCAKQAMECQPNTHQPYTLMGAICYDRHELLKGDKWFDMAVERGAKLENIDDEIKKIVRMTKDKDKRQEVVKHLLRKDPKRYAWAKSYLKQDAKTEPLTI